MYLMPEREERSKEAARFAKHVAGTRPSSWVSRPSNPCLHPTAKPPAFHCLPRAPHPHPISVTSPQFKERELGSQASLRFGKVL